MTDCFALLDQARRPWLDADTLKQVFHEKTLSAHPDAQERGADAMEAEAAFAQLNEAYQVLQDPKRRLQHLLTLEDGMPVSADAAIPTAVAEIFQSVALVTHQADSVLQKAGAAANPLSRSLLRPELLRARNRVDEVLADAHRLLADAEEELQRLDRSWLHQKEENFADLHRIYLRFSYLMRWIGRLEEKQLQLALQ